MKIRSMKKRLLLIPLLTLSAVYCASAAAAEGAKLTEAEAKMFTMGANYERYMGRWSRRLAPQFLDWLGVAGGLGLGDPHEVLAELGAQGDGQRAAPVGIEGGLDREGQGSVIAGVGVLVAFGLGRQRVGLLQAVTAGDDAVRKRSPRQIGRVRHRHERQHDHDPAQRSAQPGLHGGGRLTGKRWVDQGNHGAVFEIARKQGNNLVGGLIWALVQSTA